MKYHSEVASVVGHIDGDNWGQVLVLPQAYGIIQIRDVSGNALNTGVELLSELTEALDTPPSNLEALKSIGSEVYRDEVITLVLFVPVGTVLYMVLYGSGRVYLKRGNKIACLMKSEGAMSGVVKPGDIILATSKGVSTALTEDDLMQTFDNNSPKTIAEKMTMRLHEKDESNGASSLVYSVHEQIAEGDYIDENDEEEVKSPRAMLRIKPSKEAFSKFFRLPQAASFLHRLIGRVDRKFAIAGLVFTVLFIISVVLGVKKQASNSLLQDVAAAVSTAEELQKEAVALLPLNRLKSREKLLEAQHMLSAYVVDELPTSKEALRLESLSEEIAENLRIALQIHQIDPAIFFDAGLLKKDAYIQDVSVNGERIILSDKNHSAVYEVSLSSKKGSIIGGGEQLQGIQRVAASETRVFVLKDDGVSIIDEGYEPGEIVIPRSDQWGRIQAMGSYGENVYLVDVYHSRVWKYTPSGAGYGELREYLNPDTLPDLREVNTMAIDGSVWLSTNDGQILKFTGGKQDTFEWSGVEPSFGERLSVYVNEEIENVYVLDEDNKRIVVLAEDGLYIAQYAWSGDIEVQSMFVSEKAGLIVLLIDGKLYSIGLQQ